jgi:endonuclease/exonuclease/phosphatase family metal-dependent hydrolase
MSNSGGRFGNVLLSRYPIMQWDNNYYRNIGTEVRGVLRATVDSPIGKVTFYATHLDHRSRHVALRDKQVQELLALWANQPHAVILGDLNARPFDLELAALVQRGLIDVLAATDQDDVHTYWNVHPLSGYRIDYIFVTPDFTVTRAWVPQTRASDHLPVMVELGAAPTSTR